MEYFSNIIHDSVNDASPSYKLNDFPPSDDFPMVTDFDGNVVSRYGDPYYDYSLICGRPIRISFTNPVRSAYPIVTEDLSFLRVFTAYLQFGDSGCLSPRTMQCYVSCLRQLISFCNTKDISIQELYRYPLVQEEFAQWFVDKSPSKVKMLLMTLQKMYAGREIMGFVVLDNQGLAAFAGYCSAQHQSIQTAYIPSRIWNYQLSRLSHFLQRYIDCQDIFEYMFEDILSAYLKNCGSIELATRAGRLYRRSPFARSRLNSGVYLGSFSDYAREMKVLDVISELIYAHPVAEITPSAGGKPFGRYLNALCFIGQILLMNFSGMRVSEASGLRSDAFYQDTIGGEKVYLLKGSTTKTLKDDNALWVTSEIAEMAIRVMTSISKLRMKVACLDSRIPTSADEVDNPYLFVYGYEPWLPSKVSSSEREMSIRTWLNYSQWRKCCPGLFDEESITITSGDLNEALLVTPDLSIEKFQVGKPWPFAYHQLRRTLYVNACQSGLVSEHSGQFQLKHYFLTMTRHYGRNYSALALNRGAGDEFFVELHQKLANAALELNEDNYASLLSEKHKQSVLAFLQDKDVAKLLRLVKDGKFRFRRNLLGLCFSTSPCQYGGFDNIVNCAACTEGLVDKRNLSKLETFLKIVGFELEHERAESPRFESLQAQYKVAENAIEVITIE